MTALRTDSPFGGDPFAPREPSCTPGSPLAECPEHAEVSDFHRDTPWLVDLHPDAVSPKVQAPKPELRPVEEVSKPELRPVEKFVRAELPSAEPPAKSRVPRPKWPVVDPVSQNDHGKCLSSLSGLSATDRWVAHTLAKLCYMGRQPGNKREATAQYLADQAKVPLSAARRSADRSVLVGLFQRLDNGRGGTHGKNPATYVPKVPAWWESRRSTKT